MTERRKGKWKLLWWGIYTTPHTHIHREHYGWFTELCLSDTLVVHMVMGIPWGFRTEIKIEILFSYLYWIQYISITFIYFYSLSWYGCML